MKIKSYRTFEDYTETEGRRIVLTLKNDSVIVLVEPTETDCTLRIFVNGELIIYPKTSNTCELGILK
jgi:hypothetical protein